MWVLFLNVLRRLLKNFQLDTGNCLVPTHLIETKNQLQSLVIPHFGQFPEFSLNTHFAYLKAFKAFTSHKAKTRRC